MTMPSAARGHIVLATLALWAHSAFASPPPGVVDTCSALRVADFSRVGAGEAPTKVMTGEMQRELIVSATQADQNQKRANALGAPIPKTLKLPPNCRVDGYVSPHIKFEMRLPDPAAWNGKFLLAACDGFCGKVSQDSTMVGLLRGYATLTTDGGHWGEHPFDAIWANDNVQARIDFAYRANHVLLMAAKAIIATYYGREPRYSYITGCSKGGQAGIMAAQRYPGDFDGVLSRGPVIDYTNKNVLSCGQVAMAASDAEGRTLLDASKTPLILRKVMQACDGSDGLEDGLISDPRLCKFDPAVLSCAEGQAAAECLSPVEVDALRKIYAPVRNAAGEVIYPAGTALGSEMSWPNWALPSNGDYKTYSWKAWSEYLKYMAFRDSPGPEYDPRGFSFDTDLPRLADMSAVFDATSPDLRAFEKRDGKMIITHGWADGAVPAEMTVKWFEEMTHFMGGRELTSGFARLFLLPGVQHCNTNGVGPGIYDGLALLEAWVERGEAPDMMLTTKERDGIAERTRPVYPYPLRARYNGKGSVDEAASFVAFDPTAKRR